MTALDLITLALQDLGVVAGGETVNANDASDALTRLNNMIAAWADERLTIYQITPTTFPLVANTQTYTVGSGATVNIPRPIWIHAAGLVLTSPSPDVEIPVTIITDSDWANISIKSLTSTYPTRLWYNYGFDSSGYGTLYMWPVPTEVNNFTIYVPTQLSTLAALSTTVSFPPGYAEALEYNLAARLSIPFGRPLTPDLDRQAKQSLARIKRANKRLEDLTVDPALWSRSGPGGYNWRSDTFSGGRNNR